MANGYCNESFVSLGFRGPKDSFKGLIVKIQDERWWRRLVKGHSSSLNIARKRCPKNADTPGSACVRLRITFNLYGCIDKWARGDTEEET